jgi:hypothetical protein
MNEFPDVSPQKRAEQAARDLRLGQALRDNLRRRKEQARTRAGRTATPTDAGSGLSDAPLSGKTDRHGGTTAD